MLFAWPPSKECEKHRSVPKGNHTGYFSVLSFAVTPRDGRKVTLVATTKEPVGRRAEFSFWPSGPP